MVRPSFLYRPLGLMERVTTNMGFYLTILSILIMLICGNGCIAEQHSRSKGYSQDINLRQLTKRSPRSLEFPRRSEASPGLTVVQAIKIPPALPRRCLIDGVPQLYQSRNECGPASLAMVLNYWGLPVTRDRLKEVMDFDEKQGTSPGEMYRLPAALGLAATQYTGDLPKLMENLSQGRPVIVNQWFNQQAKKAREMTHFRVVVGYDSDRRLFFLRDPDSQMGTSTLTFDTFLELWNINRNPNYPSNWMLVVSR